MTQQTRRTFLGTAAGGSALACVAGAGGGTARASQASSPHQPHFVAGSPYPSFSRAVTFNGVVYVAGVVGQKPGSRELASGEFEPQCRQAMENLKASVEAAGSRMDLVLKCQCFLTNGEDFAAFNAIYGPYFPSNPPARSTVIVKDLVVKGALLEIDCFAALPGS